jgi:phosphoserine phosphatase RsbU/P
MACRMAHPQFASRPSLVIPAFSLVVSLAFAFGSLAASAQAFDATDLHHPVEIGTVGVVKAGDNPAYAQPDLDDSKWLPVDAKTLLSEYFPHNQPPVIWRRMHLKVSPQQTELALQAYSISRAFELYVNGEKLMESGQVEPFVPYTRDARQIVRIPDTQLRTGSLVIAIRARAPRRWWTSDTPSFPASMLTVGDESALRNQTLIDTFGENAANVLGSLLGLGVGLVALALFTSQRRQHEYVWIFLMGTAFAAQLPLSLLALRYNLTASLMIADELLSFVGKLAFLLIFQAFLRMSFSWLLWSCAAVALFAGEIENVNALFGSLSSYGSFLNYPLWIILAIVLPLLVFRQLRRGNREAGVLLLPIFFFSVLVYVSWAAEIMELFPILHAAGLPLQRLLNPMHIGIVSVGLDELGILSFWLSLTIIMVLRSTRMSRQQAVFEGELAAAREVQKVILPDAVQTVPGFTVESVYQPAQQVGGDFFQILPDSRGGLLLVVGDVAGKGLPAAMLVSVLVGATRTAAVYSQSPQEVLAQLNERLIGRTHGGFSTALAAHITADGWVTIANAGHLSPYLDGREVELHAALPLGIVANAAYETTQFHLPHAARLTFYSDGVVEAQNQKGELFGFDRAKAISTQSAAAIVDAAIQFGQSDDITVVAIRRAAAIATAA